MGSRVVVRRLLALGFGTVAGVLAAELALRIRHSGDVLTSVLADATLHQADPVLTYRLVPGVTAHGVHVNRLGLRGKEVSAEHGAARRILCLGNSITFGESIEDDGATYPARLEAAIEQLPGAADVEVLNAGTMGYSTRQCRRLALELLPRLRPDLVIVCAGWNDLTFARRIGWHPDMTWITPIDAWRLDESFLFDFVRRRLLHAPRPPDERALSQFAGELRKLAALTRRQGCALAFVDLPTVFAPQPEAGAAERAARNGYTLDEAESFLRFRTVLRETASELGVPVLADGLEFEAHDKVRYLADVCHPTEEGCVLMAEVLAPQVARLLH